jgi:cleavage and polyadenylation specificity factor subunit 1
MEQLIGNSWRPLAFFSKKFRQPETRYSTFDREMLAIKLALKHWRCFLNSWDVHVVTDHEPLTHALQKKTSSYSEVQLRRLSFILSMTRDIRYIQGKENCVADALSRSLTGEVDPVLASVSCSDSLLLDIAKAQLDDDFVKSIPPNHAYWKRIDMALHRPLVDTRRGGRRLYVPQSLRQRVLSRIHHLSHGGIAATRYLVSQNFIWPGISADTRHFVRHCHHCQKSKVTKHHRSPLQPFDDPSGRFGHLHVDIVGPLPSSEGISYLFTIVDRFTRFPSAYPMRDMTTECCTNALLQWISFFGLPRFLTSDRGSQFESTLWSSLMTRLGITHQSTTSYHPQSNGLVERFHRQLKDSFRAKLSTSSWVFYLPVVLLAFRNTLKPDIGFSPPQMTFASSLCLPGAFLDGPPSATQCDPEYVRSLIALCSSFCYIKPEHHCQSNSQTLKGLEVCDHVYVLDKTARGLDATYRGPFRVLSRHDKFFKLQLDRSADSVSIDRLKPACLSQDQDRLPSTFTRSGRASRPPNRYSPSLFS